MSKQASGLLEETLDPKDWESTRKLGHRILDYVLDYLKTLRDRPVWQHASSANEVAEASCPRQ